jgi:AsmA protein
MKLRQIPWKWLLLGLIVLLLGGLAILPRQLGDSHRLATRVTDALSAWTGGEVKLTGPLRVQYFPDVAIKSGFEITNATRLPLVKSITTRDARLSLDLTELLLGRIKIDALRLLRPEITLKEAPSMVMGPDQTLQARVANLLGGAPVDVLRVRDGTIAIPTPTGTEALKKIDARIDVSAGTGAMSSFGSFQLRGETVRFALDCAAPSDMADGLRIPINLTFTAQPLTAKVTGTASFATGLQIDGNVQADMASARDFLIWAGIGLPPGKSLKKLSATGLAHWNGTTLTFDDGSFTLDGNEAVGLLAVTPGARPRIDGTLAFDRLALDPYIGTAKPAEQDVTVTASLGGQPLLKYFDADLRISAAEITAPTLSLGRGVFTIGAKQGVVLGEVGELEFCGGSAAGRIGLDMSQDVTKATFTAKASDIPVEDCLRQMALDAPFTGTGALKAELSAEGQSYEELIQAVGGTVKVNVENGAVPIDFTRLLTTVTPLEGGDGWNPTNVTSFDQLTADCRLGTGHIWCETFTMQTPRGLISGSGDIDLGQQTVDWNLFVADHAQPLNTSQLGAEIPPRVSIRGALSQPMIRRADRPTLGDGSVQANPAADQISPR